MKDCWHFFILITTSSLCLSLRENQSVTLMFVGDVSTDGPNRYFATQGMTTYNDAFTSIAPIIRQADLAIANLEGAVGTSSIRNNPVQEPDRQHYLLGTPESLQSLKTAGFDLVSLANNHMNDYGDSATKLTREILEEIRIEYFGINYGRDPYESQVPVIKDVKGIRLGFLGYDHITSIQQPDEDTRKKFQEGMALFSETTLLRDLSYLKEKQVDVITVLMHWGIGDSEKIIQSQRDLAEFLTKSGVHLVIGAHSHRLHKHSFYNNSLVAYSLGNFLFGPVASNYWKFFSRQRSYKLSPVTKEDVATFQSKAKRARDPSRILKVEVTKDGLKRASYLPCDVIFNSQVNSVQVVPSKNAEWISVCGKEDKHCIHMEGD